MLLPRVMIGNIWKLIDSVTVIALLGPVISCSFLLDYHFYSYCSLHRSSFSGRPKEQILGSTLHDKKPIEPSLLPTQVQRDLVENRSQQLHNVPSNVCFLHWFC